MSNAKQKRAVAAHIEWRNREMISDVVMVARPHSNTVVAVGKRVIMRKDGKTPRKRMGCIVAWRNVDVTSRATLVESPSSMGARPDYDWKKC